MHSTWVVVTPDGPPDMLTQSFRGPNPIMLLLRLRSLARHPGVLKSLVSSPSLRVHWSVDRTRNHPTYKRYLV